MGKQRTKNRILMIAALLIIVCMAVSSCGKAAPEPVDDKPVIENLAIQHEPEFGGVYIRITIDDFNALGFEYGDSVKVVFSNGYTLEDIPYYNGYYVDAGDPLLIAYPGYDYIKAAINYGADLWDEGRLYSGIDMADDPGKFDLFAVSGVDEHCTASVYLNERGTYIGTQKARDIHYSDDRSKFPSDAVFANFRNVTMGDIKEGVMFRSASPCDNQHKRAPYVDALIAEAGVRCILDLADSDAKIEGYISSDGFASPYFLSLYEEENVIPLAMSMNFTSDDFRSKIAMGFTALSEKEGPYLIHCTEGKDRTGFICMLIEALCGAGYDEIVDDYMVTYANYYKITEKSDPEKYGLILEKNLIDMLYVVAGDASADLRTVDLSACAREYLKGCGMTEEQIDAFRARFTE
ncbi:MAG: tyrosine-protein phosphatase [Firmicutes bacterium]|nr:tyrosine-protein phosphatase [Bacillota bacterium]